ncbi:MAG: hypothetical protein PHC53_03995 [Patescibacteria group bacterium]|nr:hypothetical protein [Patescibacteria group bacterium]
MKEKAFPTPDASSEPLKSGIRKRADLRLPSVPGLQRTIVEKKPQESKGTLRDDAFKLTGPAALKLTSLEMKLKKELRAAKNEESREEIQERLDQCEDLARMLDLHSKDLIEQDAKISQENRPVFNYDPELYKKIVEAQRKEQATRKLEVHPDLMPLLREINEFIEDNSEIPENLSRAA